MKKLLFALGVALWLAGFLCCHFWWLGNPAVDRGQQPLNYNGKGQ